MIMAWDRPQPGSLPCYTFGGMFRDCQDVTLSRQVANMCGQPHQVITAGKEFLSRFPHYAERAIYLTDGCVDVSRSPDLYLNEKARAIAPVRMTGNYGGEVLRRIRTFKPAEPLPGLFHPDTFSHVQIAGGTYGRVIQGHQVSFAAFKQNPWNHYGILALEQTQLSLRSPFLDNDLVRTVFRAPEALLAGNEVSLRLIADGKRELLRIPTDRGFAGEQGRLSRATYRRFLEFQFKAEYAYDMGMPQRMAMIDLRLFRSPPRTSLPREAQSLPFPGLVPGCTRWICSGNATGPAQSLQAYIERKRLEEVVRGHLKGDRNYTTEIHKVLTLEIVHRLFFDRIKPAQWLRNPLRLPSARTDVPLCFC